MITLLTDEEIEFCKENAIKRYDWNKKQGNSDIADYNKSLFNLTSLQANFESRRANKQSSPLPVRKKDLDQNVIVVQGYAHYQQDEKFGRIYDYGQVTWNGWLEAEAAWELGTVPSWSKNGDSKVVELKQLKAMEDLYDTLGTIG